MILKIKGYNQEDHTEEQIIWTELAVSGKVRMCYSQHFQS